MYLPLPMNSTKAGGMMTNEKAGQLIIAFVLYSLSYLLLLEWLLPLPYITDTGYIPLFMIATLLFYLVNITQRPLLIVTVKLFVILYGLSVMFFDGQFFEKEWLIIFFKDFVENIVFLATGNLLALTDLFRSFLFFVLLAILSYLLFYWTVKAKRILFFFILTVLFITVIDTFTAYDATMAIIRIFVTGFLLLGLVRMYRTMEQSQVKIHSKWLLSRLVMALLFIIGGASIFGFLAPKFDPQWPDPVPFMKAAVGFGEPIIEQKIGYGNNDERLGGGFSQDDTPIFYAKIDKGHYYRGETKNYYSGKGWEVTTPEELMDLPFPTFEYGVQLVEKQAEISLTGNQLFSHIFYPGEVVEVKSPAGMLLSVMVDSFTLKGMAYNGNRPVMLEAYSLSYYEPIFSAAKLRGASNEDPDYIRSYYLQLPDSLPDRVRQLTEEIISEYDNRYDQAKAVERYLASGIFTYETKDVAIPEEDDDYVDQFLFETKKGYCDNFSTAMAVMLRSVGIPTRWVKGFTQGEHLSTEAGISEYVITNAHAHSWVEVYFPGHGWVPFEPTKGFHFSGLFAEEEIAENELDMTEEEQQEQQTEEQEETEPVVEEQEESIQQFIFNMKAIVFGGLIIVIVIGIFVFGKKRSIERGKISAKYIQSVQKQTFESEFESLLSLMERKGFVRKQGETLREFAIRMERNFGITEMLELVKIYEQYSYGSNRGNELTDEQKALIEQIKQKITS